LTAAPVKKKSPVLKASSTAEREKSQKCELARERRDEGCKVKDAGCKMTDGRGEKSLREMERR
jgi:hypothetical protein